MAYAQAELEESGLSLWLTTAPWLSRHSRTSESWIAHQLLALVGDRVAAHLDFFVHPDQGAVTVGILNTRPGYEKRGYASVLMDALHAAHPTAWINHGSRTKPGCRWWTR